MDFILINLNIIVNILKIRHKIQTIVFILLITGIHNLIIFGKSVDNRNYYNGNCEFIFVHLDRTVYVAGDNVNYKAYVLNDNNQLQSPESKILYFVLTERKSGEQILRRVNISKSTLHGSFKLPGNMNAGVYQLAVFTNLLRESYPENIFYRELLILNLAKEVPDSLCILPLETVNITQTKNGTRAADQPVIRLRLAKSVFSTTEKVILEISAENLQNNDTANLSISISNETPFDRTFQKNDIIEQLNRYKEKNDRSCSAGLENHSYMLSGRILNKRDSLPVNHAGVFLAVIDSLTPKILYSAIDENNRFHFYLNQFYDNKVIILQPASGAANSDIIWDLDKKTVPYRRSSKSPVLLSADQIKFLNQVKDLRLIEEVTAESITAQKTTKTLTEISYFACPDITIIPDDYAEMANFREIAANIIPQLKLRSRKENYYLEVYNDSKGSLGDNNLVLLNGVPFSDLNYIATLGTRDIKKIEIINSGRFMAGDLVYNAVVSIYTHDVGLPEPYLKNYTMILQNTVAGTNEESYGNIFEVPEHSWSHFPDFRSNLYWNPELKISGNNAIAVEFTTSWLEGKFYAEVQGITSSGSPVVAYVSFIVGEDDLP